MNGQNLTSYRPKLRQSNTTNFIIGFYTTYQADMQFNYFLIIEKLKVREASPD